ncbi:acetyltransferase [Virgibacillus flavescens]|uniref:acetyltransferase n=1 Tax=Virgibacillus flavescens TaxID=1611422 RepID=UPI003D35817C
MQVIIIGDGGHSRVIQEMIISCGSSISAILDDKYEHGIRRNGIIYAQISFLPKLLKKDTKIVIAIGSNAIRKRIVRRINIIPEMYATIIHPTAVISTSAQIGYGTVVMPHVVINAQAAVGTHCIINTASIIEHDNTIGDFSHISPNATLTGNVTTGEGVHVGASSTIIPGKHLGSWSIIGAGSTVIEHIPAYSKAVGCPTRIIERILIK